MLFFPPRNLEEMRKKLEGVQLKNLMSESDEMGGGGEEKGSSSVDVTTMMMMKNSGEEKDEEKDDNDDDDELPDEFCTSISTDEVYNK